jgi:hypothetical protein
VCTIGKSKVIMLIEATNARTISAKWVRPGAIPILGVETEHAAQASAEQQHLLALRAQVMTLMPLTEMRR